MQSHDKKRVSGAALARALAAATFASNLAITVSAGIHSPSFNE